MRPPAPRPWPWRCNTNWSVDHDHQRSGSLRFFALTLGWSTAFWGIAAVAGAAQGFGVYRLAWATLFALMVILLSDRR